MLMVPQGNDYKDKEVAGPAMHVSLSDEFGYIRAASIPPAGQGWPDLIMCQDGI